MNDLLQAFREITRAHAITRFDVDPFPDDSVTAAEVVARHAELLADASARVAVLACPCCGGRLLAGDATARCTAGCGWVPGGPVPIASRRADR